MNTLPIRAKRISNATHLKLELDHLVDVFKANGYTENQIKKTIKTSQIIHIKEKEKETDDIIKTISLPYT